MIFEVVDSDGAIYVVSADLHYIGNDEDGRERHEFVPPQDHDAPSVVWTFTAPQSVREVPA